MVNSSSVERYFPSFTTILVKQLYYDHVVAGADAHTMVRLQFLFRCTTTELHMGPKRVGRKGELTKQSRGLETSDACALSLAYADKRTYRCKRVKQTLGVCHTVPRLVCTALIGK